MFQTAGRTNESFTLPKNRRGGLRNIVDIRTQHGLPAPGTTRPNSRSTARFLTPSYGRRKGPAPREQIRKRYTEANARPTGAKDSKSASQAAQYWVSNGARPIWNLAPRQFAGPELLYRASTSSRVKPKEHTGNSGTCATLPAQLSVAHAGGEWNSSRDTPNLACGGRLFFNATDTFWGAGGSAWRSPSGHEAGGRLRALTPGRKSSDESASGEPRTASGSPHPGNRRSSRRGARRSPFVGRVTNLVRVVRGAQHPFALTVVQNLQTARQLGNSANYHQHVATTRRAARVTTPRLRGLLTFGHRLRHFAFFARQGKRPRALKGFG